MRFRGSEMSSCLTKSLPSDETFSQAVEENETVPAWIFISFSASLRPLKGRVPHIMK